MEKVITVEPYNKPFLLRFSMGFCCARPQTPAWIQTAAKSFDPVSGWDSFREVRDYTPSKCSYKDPNTGSGSYLEEIVSILAVENGEDHV